MKMINKVRTYIDREIELSTNAYVFVALSGGADSTALLLIMKELGYRLHALHCNFHLRGEESDRDQAFVEELCRQQHVPLSVRHFQTEKEAKQRSISIEMAARDLRYAWFRKILEEQCSKCSIAVAHHREDQAETLLLNLIRGTGLRGLKGMQPKHDDIIRPLLCLSREEILGYLERRGQTYVTDSTNLERVAQRNRIRLDVIPLLQSICPAVVEQLCLACDNVRESIPYYKKGIEAAFGELGITANSFPLNVLSQNGVKEGYHTLLHEWLAGKGFNQAQEKEMLRAKYSSVGKMWVSNSHKVLRDRESLLLSPVISHPLLPNLCQKIVPCMQEKGPNIAYFDADLLTAPIKVRPVQNGDVFVPFGMEGRKLVSDYLTDRKVNRLQKAEQFVATCGDDIIWLIGHRSDNRYRITTTTTRILKLTVFNPSEDSKMVENGEI